MPKPGNTPHTDNMQAISLTIFREKVVEGMVIRRLQRHLDDTRLMPITMSGFSEGLSTHNVLVQIHELVIKKAENQIPRAMLALNLEGAFDNVTHASTLRHLNNRGCGEKIFKYTKDLLSN